VNIFAELCRGRMAHLPEITEVEARKMLRPLGCGAQAVTQEAPVDDLDQPDTLEQK
jgi:hypothetical protein